MLDGTGELPAGWAWARLGEICDLVGGVTVDAKRTGADLVEVPYLRVANVQRGRICLHQVKTIRIPQIRIEQLRLVSGDVLLNEGGDRDKVGRGWVWEGQVSDCVFQNHIFRARPRSPEVNPFYVSHYLNEIGRSYFLAGAKQTTNLASLSLSKVAEAPVMLAPPAEQTRIIAEIARLFAELDEAEAALARARAGLAEYRASLLHAACTGQLTAAWRASRPPPAEDGPALLRRILAERRAAWERAELARLHARGKPAPVGEGWKARYQEPVEPNTDGLPALPDGWTWASLEQLCSIVGGITVDAKRTGDGLAAVPYLRVANVQRGRLELSQVKTLQAPTDRIEALRLVPNDVLLNEGGDRDKVGRGWVWAGELPLCIHQNHVFRARPCLPEMDGRFISHYLNEMGRAYFLDAAIQTTNLASISMAKVSRVPVPVPPLDELRQIVNLIASGLEEAEAGGAFASEIATLRQSILHAAFTGRLVPQDPADEPAAALLARLRAIPAPPRRTRPSAA